MDWFRHARPAAPSWNAAKTAVQVVLFWTVFLFVVPAWLVTLSDAGGLGSHPFPAGRVTAVVLFAAASTLGLWSGFTMAILGGGTPLPIDAPRTLVVAGPYAWVRNPMAVAGLAQGAAVALWHGSLVVAAYVVAGGLIWHVGVRPLEEADLRRRFGQAFEDYRRRVPLWWPRRPGLRPDAERPPVDRPRRPG